MAQRTPAYLPGQSFQLQRDCSEQTARDIDEEVRRILDNSYAEAKDLLATHRNELHRVVEELLKLAVVYTPFLQQGFSTVSLSVADWLRCIAVASSVLWLSEAAKGITRSMAKRKPTDISYETL